MSDSDFDFDEAETVILSTDMARRFRQQVLVYQREAQERARRRRRVGVVVGVAAGLGVVGLWLALGA